MTKINKNTRFNFDLDLNTQNVIKDKNILYSSGDFAFNDLDNFTNELIEINERKKRNIIKGNSQFEHQVVDIETFLDDPYYLGLKNEIRPVIKDYLIELFDGKVFNWKFKEVAIYCGIGFGKSYFLKCLILYIVYCCLCLKNPQQYFGLSKTSGIACIIMSINALNAFRKVYTDVYNTVRFSPFFKENYPPNPKKYKEMEFDKPPREIELIRDDKIYKNILIYPGSSAANAPTGYDIICGVIDEVTMLKHSKDLDVAQDIYDNFHSRITSRFGKKGMIAMVGSPRYTGDFLQRKQKTSKISTHIMCKTGATYDSKISDPKDGTFYFDIDNLVIWGYNRAILDDEENIVRFEFEGEREKIFDENNKFFSYIREIPMEYEISFSTTPLISKRDLAAIPIEVLKPIFGDSIDKIEEYAKKDYKNPIDNDGKFKSWFHNKDKDGKVIESDSIYYVAHVDLATTGDACALGVGHLEPINKNKPCFNEYKIVIDFIYRMQGSKKRPIQIKLVREMFYELTNRGFKFEKITYDSWQSTDSVQTLRDEGYDAAILSVDKSTTPYELVVEHVLNQKIEYPNDAILIRELKTLELIKTATGFKIDHPPHSSKDMADCMAGITFNCCELLKFYGELIFESSIQSKLV